MEQQGSDRTAEVARLGARIERWRATRQKRWPMPEPLWEQAVALARRQGVGPIARGLRLDYYSLKRRVVGPEVEPCGAVDGARGFVEVDLAGVRSGEEWRIELVGGDGAKITVAVQGAAARDLDLAGLLSAFLGRR